MPSWMPFTIFSLAQREMPKLAIRAMTGTAKNLWVKKVMDEKRNISFILSIFFTDLQRLWRALSQSRDKQFQSSLIKRLMWKVKFKNCFTLSSHFQWFKPMPLILGVSCLFIEWIKAMEKYNNISFWFCITAKLTTECTQWRRGCRKVVFQGSVWGTPAQRSRTIRKQAAADPLDRTLQGCHKHTAPRLDQRTTDTHAVGVGTGKSPPLATHLYDWWF